jgi:hypothetical protein
MQDAPHFVHRVPTGNESVVSRVVAPATAGERWGKRGSAQLSAVLETIVVENSNKRLFLE